MLDIKSDTTLSDKSDKFLGWIDERFKGKTSFLDGISLSVGPQTSSSFAMDGHAPHFPLHVEPENIGKSINLDKVKPLFKTSRAKDVRFNFQLNEETGKYDIVYHAKGFTDGFNDSAFNLITSQALSPSSFGFARRPFREVLAYSNAEKAIKIETGDNPWATAFNLGTIGYGGGFAEISSAGTAGNNYTFDVQTSSGALSNVVLNIVASYSLTVEETSRMQQGTSWQYGGLALSEKQRYAAWTLDMYRDVLTWFGHAPTGLMGVLNVNPITSYAGSSTNYIGINNATNPGQVMYQQLATLVVNILNQSINKLNVLNIFLSPVAYNNLTSYPYSSYDPASSLEILVENFMGGSNREGKTPKIEFIVEPLFNPTIPSLGLNNSWNNNTFDYMAIVAPEIAGGTTDDNQDLILGVRPLDKYVYPAVPGAYMTQIKMLTRFGGVIAPYSPAVAVYTGFGIKSATT
jgi:hypothetical protein